MAIGVDGIYGLHAPTLYDAEGRKSKTWGPAAAPALVIGPTVRPYIVQAQANPSGNQSYTLTPATFTPAAIPVIPMPPAPAGGLLPGVLGGGLGPYKRPGQVFGERDPVSPFLSSTAQAIPAVAQGAPAGPLAHLPNQPLTLVSSDDDLIGFLILHAMDGPLH